MRRGGGGLQLLDDLAWAQHIRMDRLLRTYFWYRGWTQSVAVADYADFAAWMTMVGVQNYREPGGHPGLLRHHALNILLQRRMLHLYERPYGHLLLITSQIQGETYEP